MTGREQRIAKLKEANGQELYGGLVNKEVTKAHPKGDEFAIIRKALLAVGNGQPLPQEFIDYCAEVEGIKTQAKNDCGLS